MKKTAKQPKGTRVPDARKISKERTGKAGREDAYKSAIAAALDNQWMQIDRLVKEVIQVNERLLKLEESVRLIKEVVE